ncbi:hypothetical protein SDJN02_26193, partial [Cucurbita argyrosperma subsp. argyrosperma]
MTVITSPFASIRRAGDVFKSPAGDTSARIICAFFGFYSVSFSSKGSFCFPLPEAFFSAFGCQNLKILDLEMSFNY